MRWLPQSLFGRLVLLMTAGLVAAQLAGTAIQFSERRQSLRATVGTELAQRVGAMHRAIGSQPPDERARLAGRLSTPRLLLSVEPSAPPDTIGASALPDLPALLREGLGEDVTLRVAALPRIGSPSFDLYLQLPGDQWLRLQGRVPRQTFAHPWRALIDLAVMLLAVVVLVVIVTRSTVRPLADLARAARGFADDLNHPPLPEKGPSEVREAAAAFNAMQTRIRSGIEERERFLAAVSHDLKTPVTRLRLRAELTPDPVLRDAILRDVDDMQQLIDDALDFLSGNAVEEPVGPVDLVALVERVVDDFAHTGQVTLDAPDALRFDARPRALQRALRNLVDNALKYGGNAHVVLAANPDGVVITVEDDGPGIPEDALESVFEPFRRLEASRSRETGGTGLGLAIVRQVARIHGGEARLANRGGGGLRAEIRLPAKGR